MLFLSASESRFEIICVDSFGLVVSISPFLHVCIFSKQDDISDNFDFFAEDSIGESLSYLKLHPNQPSTFQDLDQ